MIETLVTLFLQAIFLAIMIAGVFSVIWMMFQVVKFINIAMRIHSGASKRPYGHVLPLANFLDSKVLNEEEKALRSEGLKILIKLAPVVFLFFIFVAIIAVFTS